MSKGRLCRANELGDSPQLGFVHDAEGLHQTVAQQFWGFVFGEGKELFEWDVEVLGNQFQCVNAGVMHPTLKPGQVARVDSHEVGQRLLRHAALLAKFLDSPAQFLSRVCHAVSLNAWVNVPQGKYSGQGGPRLQNNCRWAANVPFIPFSHYNRRVAASYCVETDVQQPFSR